MMGMVDPPRLDKQDIAASLALKHRDRGARHFRERRLSGGVGGPVGLIAHMIGLEEAEKVRCGRQIGPLEHRAVRHKGAAGMRFFPFGDEVAAIGALAGHGGIFRSEEHTSELQSLMRISYAVFCLKKKTN